MTSSFPSNRITRRRSSATLPTLQPPSLPTLQPPSLPTLQPPSRPPAAPQPRPPVRSVSSTPGASSAPRAPFLTLNDHGGRVYVADLPRLSDGQLVHLAREAGAVFASLEQRIAQLEADLETPPRDTVIRASTKRDVTARFMKAIEDEQNNRRNNPQRMTAAGASLSHTFMEVARHRLPGESFDSLLQEALTLVNRQEEGRQREGNRSEQLPVAVSDLSAT